MDIQDCSERITCFAQKSDLRVQSAEVPLLSELNIAASWQERATLLCHWQSSLPSELNMSVCENEYRVGCTTKLGSSNVELGEPPSKERLFEVYVLSKINV